MTINLIAIQAFLMPFLIAAATAALFAPVVISIYKKIGWVDDPKLADHPKVVHTTPVPRGGGWVIAAGLLPIVGWLLWPWNTALTGILLGALLLLISGSLDDNYDIHPYIRYGVNILAGLIVIASGVGIDFVTNPFGPGVIDLNIWMLPIQTPLGNWEFSLLADGFALLWIVWNMNAVNWSKGVDGQLPGFVAIAAFCIALLSLRFQADVTQIAVTTLALGVSGAFTGLLLWNHYPQRMMPGYAAGSLGGYFLAILAIFSGAKVATVLLLLAIPMADGIFTVTRRIARGRNPFWGDRGHLHHRLLDAGWSKANIARFYWLTTLIFGVIALQLNSEGKLYAIMAAGILFATLILWLRRLSLSSEQHDHDSG